MILLRDHDRWGFYATLELDTGVLTYTKRDPAWVRPSAIVGKVSELAGRVWVLYNDGAQLQLRVDDIWIALTDDVRVVHERGQPAVFSVTRGDQVLLRVSYDSPSEGWQRIDPTWDDDQYEDFDFAAFVAGTCADLERRPLVHNLAHRPEIFESEHFVPREVRGILVEQLPDDSALLARVVNRLYWPWTRPTYYPMAAACAWCGVRAGSTHWLGRLWSADDAHPLRGMGSSEDALHLCGGCIELSLVFLESDAPALFTAHALEQIRGAIRADGFAHGETMIGALDAQATLAGPPVTSGPPCSSCGTTDVLLARGPWAAYCAPCLRGDE